MASHTTLIREVVVDEEVGRLVWQRLNGTFFQEETTLTEVARIRALKNMADEPNPQEPTATLVRVQTFWKFNTVSGEMEQNDISYAWDSVNREIFVVQFPFSADPRTRTLIAVTPAKYIISGPVATLDVTPRDPIYDFPDNWELKIGTIRQRV